MMDIKNRTGQVRLSVPVTEKAIYRKELMKQEFILLGFSTDEIVDFGKGDYIDTGYGRFELLEPAFPAGNASTGGYDYELRFDSPLARWANFKLFYNRKGNKESNWSMTHLPQYFMEVVIANLKELDFSYNGRPYTFEIDHDYLSNVSKPLTFDGTSIFDALTRIAEAWEAEWWVEEHIIKLGHCEQKDLPAVELDSVAVSSFSRSQSNSDYATRIYAFGSERNIPANYRVDESEVAVDGVVRKRLMLPSGTPYVDAMENMAPEDIVEAVVLFDDVYPRTAGKIDKVDPVVEDINDEEGNPTGKTQTFYLITDSSLKNFSEKYIIPGQELRVVFESGLLAGMDFGVELEGSDDNGTVFRITPNTDYIVSLPNETLKPTVNSMYVLHGFDTSFVDDSLLSLAEQELLARAEAYVKKSSIDPSVYTCVMNPVRAAGYVDDVYHPDKEIDLRIGQKVTLVNSSYFPEGHSSRIYGFEKRLDNKFSCTYTVGESAEYSRLGKLEGKMQNISYKDVTYSQSGGGNIYLIRSIDDTIATDYNAFSALRTQKEFKKQSDSSDNRYLFKDRPDQTDFLLGMNDGATFGNYLGGTLGSGAMIDKDGMGEMTGLKLREFLEVPELRFNRIDVVSGELWNSIAFGLIESVDEQNRIVTLHLEEGELSGLHVNDFCRGIFHNLTGNAEQPGKDSSGFDTLVGFSTAYFTPVEIIDNARFKYELKPGTTVHPSPSMKFAVYGNALDKSRQHSAYQTRTYTRFLRNVATWEIDPGKHVSFQAGDLSNLVIDGQPLANGSVYLNNVYFGGNILTVGGLDSLKGKDAYSVTLSTYSAVYNIADGVFEQAEVVTKDQKVVTGASQVLASQFNVSTRLQVTKGEEQLRYSEVIGQGKYVVTSSGTNCIYVITDGLVAVQEVTADHATINIQVNCEGIATYDVVFTIVRVADGRDGKDYEYIFTRTPIMVAPSAPASQQSDEFVPVGWTDDSVGPAIELPYEWVSKRIKRNGEWGNFSNPSLWARFGEDGTDYEYIYARTLEEKAPETPLGEQSDDFVPKNWTDDPVGPTPEKPYEWVSKRVKVNGVWGDFSLPALWSKYAEDGTDHEFIYARTRDYNAPAIRQNSQQDGFVPKDWTNNPTGVNATFIYEWMSKRKKVKGVWIDFSPAVLWAKYSFDGEKGDQGISGLPGEPGIQGPGLNYRGEWSAVTTYYRNKNLVDVVSITSSAGVPTYYLLLASENRGNSPGSFPAIWEVQNSFKNVATDLLFAKEATISKWQFSNSYIRSLNDEVCLNGSGAENVPVIAAGSKGEGNTGYKNGEINKDASMVLYQSGIMQVGAGGGNAGICGTKAADGSLEPAVRFWAGSTYANRENAHIRMYSDGKMVSKNAVIEGDVTARSGKIGNFNISEGFLFYNDSVARIAMGSDTVPGTVGGAFGCTAEISRKQASSSSSFPEESIALKLTASGGTLQTALYAKGGIRLIGPMLSAKSVYSPTGTVGTIWNGIKNKGTSVYTVMIEQSSMCDLPSSDQISSIFGYLADGRNTVDYSVVEVTVINAGYSTNDLFVCAGYDSYYKRDQYVYYQGGRYNDNKSIGKDNVKIRPGMVVTFYYYNRSWYVNRGL